MTTLNDTELTKIANHEFTLDFLRAQLVQQVSGKPKSYEGSGCISQAADGSLSLKLYCPVDSLNDGLLGFGAPGLEPGKLIGAENYYLFEGVDVFGQTWKATNVWIDVDISFPASGYIVRAKLLTIENRRLNSSKTSSCQRVLIVPGTYRIPFTRGQPGTEEPGFSSCTLDFGNGCTCELKTRGKTLVIGIASPREDGKRFPERVVEAIGIAVGAHLAPHAEIETTANERIQVIRSQNVDASEHHRLMPPIPVAAPGDFLGFQDFVRAYVEHFEEPFSQVAGFWYRVLVGFESGLENQALVLTTAIEGVLKASFLDEGKPDEEFLKQIADAVPKIKALASLEPRARERILSTLGGAKTPTPSNSLHALSKAAKIPAAFISVWKDLRNKSAHADELTWAPADTQQFIDELYACLELFYRLIILLIGYSGVIIQYSKPAWPSGNLAV